MYRARFHRVTVKYYYYYYCIVDKINEIKNIIDGHTESVDVIIIT